MIHFEKSLFRYKYVTRAKSIALPFLSLLVIFSSCGTKKEIPLFSGDNSFAYLTTQTDFGPRNPGSSGHSKCRDYLITEFSKFADQVNRQDFDFTDEFTDSSFILTNIIASFNLNPPGNRRILLTAHWDTRPYADGDSLSPDRNTPILGANDGASGAAVLLELASVLHNNPPPIGVDIILFDGEDYGRTNQNGLDYYFIGSKHFAENKGDYRPDYAILLDMVGSAAPQFYIEGYSNQYAPTIVRKLWNKARDLGYTEFVNQMGAGINDDHVILNQAGIPTVNIIDINAQKLNYPYWHTLEDTPDKCSAETLGKIGTLLLNVIYE